jgi:hypothetical protein
MRFSWPYWNIRGAMKNARKLRAFLEIEVGQLLTTSSLRSAIVLLTSTGLPFKRFSA